MALSLYPEAAYEAVFSVVTSGLAWAAGHPGSQRIAKSSISALRSKIGFEPLKDLMDKHCVPLAEPGTHPEAFFAGLRAVVMDGSDFELPDEAANAEAFGYSCSRTGHAGYPQAQCAVLVECATHAILGACIAVRWLLHQGVSRHKLKHAEQSFVAHLNALKVNQPQSGAFTPSESEKKASLI